MAALSSTFAWKIPWTEEPSRLKSHGVAKSWTRLSDFKKTRLSDFKKTRLSDFKKKERTHSRYIESKSMPVVMKGLEVFSKLYT